MKIVVQEFKRTLEGTKCLCQFLSKYLLDTIVIEATGVYFPTVLDALEAYKNWGGFKSDALELAKLCLSGLAKNSFIPTESLRELRCLTWEIRFVDRDCTRIKNRVKRILALWGLPLKNFDLTRLWTLDVLNTLMQANGNFGKALDLIKSGAKVTSKTTRGAVTRRWESLVPFHSIMVPGSALVAMESYLLEQSRLLDLLIHS